MDEYVPRSNSRDGVEVMDSDETDRDVIVMDCFSASSSPSSNMLSESAGSSRKSRGDPLLKDDEALTSLSHSFRRCSTDSRLGEVEALSFWARLLGGGIAVTAKSAATAGGRAFAS